MRVLDACPHCGREEHLWGGPACDVCDADNSGVNDQDEPVGVGPYQSPKLFGPEEKGYVMHAGGQRRQILDGDLIHNPAREAQKLYVLQRLCGRLEAMGF